MECSDPERVGALLAELKCPWYICGGWALDLYLNCVTREHKDVDVAVARSDQWVVREYLRRRGWRLEKVSGGTLSPWLDGEWLELPIHGVFACRVILCLQSRPSFRPPRVAAPRLRPLHHD